MKQINTKNLVLGAMFLALAMVLPFLTMQIPSVGNMLLPMHIPVLLCGFFCGPVIAGVVGIVAPLLRFLLFGMPPIMPTGISMCFELATYGIICGVLYKVFPKKNIYIYASLIIAMIAGRIVWGIVRVILLGVNGTEFGWGIFMTEGFVKAIPGIILQIVLIPVLVMTLKKHKE